MYVKKVGQGTVRDEGKGEWEVVLNSHHFLQKALRQKGKPGFVSRYLYIRRTSFVGAILFWGRG